MRESERWCKITAPRHDDALTCQIDLLRGDAVGTGKEGRIRSPGQPQIDRQTGGLSVSNEGDREIRRSNVPRRSVNALTCQINFLRDDAAGRARGSDDRGGGGQSGRGDVRQGHAACGRAM